MSAQIRNLRFDSENLEHNLAIFSDVLLNVFGNDTIADWLENHKQFRVIYTTNNRGELISLDKWIGNN